MDMIRSHVTVLCKAVRKDAISITDSFNFTDFIINSPLGRYDGNIYESYFSLVNAAHKPAVIPTYFESTIYPVLNRKRADDDVLELDDE
jgi:acyl-CoA oxidase